MSEGELQVGSTLWRFDDSRRRYEVDEKGRAVGGPIWRDHWVEEQVTGETSRSWLIGPDWKPRKLPKSSFRDGNCPQGWARSQADIDKLAWVQEHRHHIANALMRVQDYRVIRRVAEIVGYGPATKKEE